MSASFPESHRSLYRADQVRKLEQLAITTRPISGIDLMERAGTATWELLRKTWPAAKKIVVVCGAGNNAGDGYILARLALQAGRELEVLALADPLQLKGDALTAAERFAASGQAAVNFSVEKLAGADVIVDAMLGTGLDREVRGEYLQAIEAVNQSGKPILSVDLPSGLNADTGKAMGIAILAHTTITFIGRKQGLFTGDGIEHRGILHISDLGVPSEIFAEVLPSAKLLTVDSFLPLLARRSRNAHKGHFGHVLIVGGEYGFAGAVQMSAVAAARSGAGLTTVATRSEHAYILPVARPEIMACGINVPADLGPVLERATVVAIGPGLGQSDWSSALFARVLDTRMPLVVDADGLNLLARDPIRRDNWVLTPHPGEAARLLGCTVTEVESDRFSASNELQNRYGGIVVLKGSGTIINGAPGSHGICAEGNPGMASGGMGDVLTGVIAGLLAQSYSHEDAAGLGVCVHARAADRIAANNGERGMLASDLLPQIQRLLNP